ncbi:MAG: acyl-CoA desaturase, partial [Janthinobacterium sp.]
MPTAGLASHRARATHAGSVLNGAVRHAPLPSLWLTAMLAGAVSGALFFFSWTGLLLFMTGTAIVLL